MSKVSPYKLFKDWLINPNDIPLDDDVLRTINQRSALCMFGNLYNITVYLNEYFNTFDVMKLDKYEFFTFLKSIVKSNKLSYRDFSFYAFGKKDQIRREIILKFPYLKPYEINLIVDKIENIKDKEHKEIMMETIDPNGKYKSKKIKKSKRTNGDKNEK